MYVKPKNLLASPNQGSISIFFSLAKTIIPSKKAMEVNIAPPITRPVRYLHNEETCSCTTEPNSSPGAIHQSCPNVVVAMVHQCRAVRNSYLFILKRHTCHTKNLVKAMLTSVRVQTTFGEKRSSGHPMNCKETAYDHDGYTWTCRKRCLAKVNIMQWWFATLVESLKKHLKKNQIQAYNPPTDDHPIWKLNHSGI